jgi:hypothetical protein
MRNINEHRKMINISLCIFNHLYEKKGVGKMVEGYWCDETHMYINANKMVVSPFNTQSCREVKYLTLFSKRMYLFTNFI